MRKKTAFSASARCPGEPWWALSGEQAARLLESDIENGLLEEDARSRLERFDRNRLPERAGPTRREILMRQFSGIIIWVLAAAGVIAAWIGESTDAAAIFLILVLNAAIGYIQERKAEHSLSALRRLWTPSCRVIRAGILRAVPAEELVPGDLVELESGDRVPADGRVVWCSRLRTQEAALTGESLPVDKSAGPIAARSLAVAERSNMAYLGTMAVSGKGLLLVTETGLSTELGRVAELLAEAHPAPTPLQVRLERFGKLLVWAFLAALVLIFLLGVARGRAWGEMLLISLSMAVAAIPEGMPTVVTVSLALGVQKMAARGALLRRLASVETLGCATVICTDKTGTLTRNEMTVREAWIGGRSVQVGGIGYAPQGEFSEEGRRIDPAAWTDLKTALRIGVLCNGAELLREGERWEIVGDPTEGALLALAAKAGLWKQDLERRYPVFEEIPFDSERKRMSVVCGEDSRRLLYVKGAPDVLLGLSRAWLKEGLEIPLTPESRAAIAAAADAMGARALRVLALAYRELKPGAIDEAAETELVFAGLAGMMDPPRPEAAAAIGACRGAGIVPVMVTGDQKSTALAVARELNLARPGSEVLTGSDLDRLSDEELRRRVRATAVYSRVSSEHKLRIVRAWKAEGEIVAMTGDGVNDAPALKEADIGAAMGLTGTDVTREAADLVITDDNFATVVRAVEQGRGIYDNILKAVVYLLSTNVAELMVVAVPLLAGLSFPEGGPLIPLSAAQLLWVNLVTDGLPALSLAADPPDPAVMSRAPREASGTLIPAWLGIQMAVRSMLVTAGTLAAALYAAPEGPRAAQSLALTSLVVAEMIKAHQVRRAFGAGSFTNPMFLAAVAGSLSLQFLVLHFPWLNHVFGTQPLTADGWALIAAIAAIQWAAGELLNRNLTARRLAPRGAAVIK